MASSRVEIPRISLNKLAEFATAKAGRQRQILKDQKFPTEYKGMYYREAAEAVSMSIANNLSDLSFVNRQISLLEQKVPEKIGTQRRIDANIDAMDNFLLMLDEIDLGGSIPSLGEISPPKIRIRNVEISVRPEVILRGTNRSGNTYIGAIKLHFPKTYTLNDDSSGYISAVLQRWVEECMREDGEPSAANCFAIDIGSRKVYKGVKSTVARLRDLESYCQNIADMWPRITPDE